jgi:D-ribulokinase
MVPGLWLNEGGQSAAGAAIDELILHHPFAPEAQRLAQDAGMSLPDWLAGHAEECDVLQMVKGLHVVPEPIGNRAPHADPNTRAAICGIGMDRSKDSLVALYLAGLCGLGYGLRQIVEAQARTGTHVKEIVISGGAGRSALVRQVLADTTGLAVAAPRAEEPVMLGSAILGAVAGKACETVMDGMKHMSGIGEVYLPDPTAVARHNARFAVYEDLQACARRAVDV